MKQKTQEMDIPQCLRDDEMMYSPQERPAGSILGHGPQCCMIISPSRPPPPPPPSPPRRRPSSHPPPRAAEEVRDCREQEFRDPSGACRACQQCHAGQELSKECGLGYGEDARCVSCRSARFKEGQGLHKCRPCLDCGLANRYQKANCSATRNALCGECLPGFYRKTKLSGFQDLECVPCGEPPHGTAYQPHCSGRVNQVSLPSVATSPRDLALAAVICSALATVLLALLVLCVIYCKRQLLEKKPGVSMRLQDEPHGGEELLYLDRHWLHDFPDPPCCRCHLSPEHTCGPVHLIPSPCWDQSCGLDPDGRGRHGAFRSQRNRGTPDQDQDQGSTQIPTGSPPPPHSAEDTWLWKHSGSLVLTTPQHSPEVFIGVTGERRKEKLPRPQTQSHLLELWLRAPGSGWEGDVVTAVVWAPSYLVGSQSVETHVTEEEEAAVSRPSQQI
ncbi:hypothetical protein NHX12_008854 [Muraenolepis orangiensis]|uniref:TNFR-Cys domain-containing protein n=1 Tax=Muraenolepis orangiensis TaxID=630683 RepID=A0A9Q0IBM2_9TELE|nr:hypothetical protein NHX12_008854 [Muraenolepis orangiensis]